jgi:hypothetical protein
METMKNTNEVEKNTAELTNETPEFKPAEKSNEVTQKMAADLEKAGQIVADTARQIREEYTPMKGKVESMPKTAAEKRLYENVGYDAEALDGDKETFSKMSNSEMYNKFQILTLQKTKDFLRNSLEGLKEEDKIGAEKVMNKINATLKTIGSENNRATKGYSEIIKENVNNLNNSNIWDGMSKLYSKSGYDSSMWNSRKVYDSFQNDLAENVLTKEQQEALVNMQKEANRNSGNSASSTLVGGMNQRVQLASVFSSKTTHELAGEKMKEVA